MGGWVGGVAGGEKHLVAESAVSEVILPALSTTRTWSDASRYSAINHNG